jgi:hypothetical protein
MKTIEEFMSAYFRERVLLNERSLRDFAPFREAFYTDNCLMSNRRKADLEHSLTISECIQSVSTFDNMVEVITTHAGPPSLTLSTRYTLRPKADRWLIDCIELECPHCRKSTLSPGCSICKGKGWFHSFEKSRSNRCKIPPKPPEDES